MIRLGKPMAVARVAANTPSSSQRVWHVIDAQNHVVGRLAAQISRILQGKHKPIYDKSTNVGDYVVVINTDKIQFATANKWDRKVYRWHTGWPGGLKEVPAKLMFERDPNNLIRRAVRGMLPKNRTRNHLMDRLKTYATEQHPHEAQTDRLENKLMQIQSGVEIEESRPVDKYEPWPVVRDSFQGVDEYRSFDFNEEQLMKAMISKEGEATPKEGFDTSIFPKDIQELLKSKDEDDVTPEGQNGVRVKFEERGSHWYMVTEDIGEGLSRFTGYRPPRPKKQKINVDRLRREFVRQTRAKEAAEERTRRYEDVLAAINQKALSAPPRK